MQLQEFGIALGSVDRRLQQEVVVVEKEVEGKG